MRGSWLNYLYVLERRMNDRIDLLLALIQVWISGVMVCLSITLIMDKSHYGLMAAVIGGLFTIHSITGVFKGTK